MKKIFLVFLSVFLIFSLSVPIAFAAELPSFPGCSYENSLRLLTVKDGIYTLYYFDNDIEGDYSFRIRYPDKPQQILYVYKLGDFGKYTSYVYDSSSSSSWVMDKDNATLNSYISSSTGTSVVATDLDFYYFDNPEEVFFSKNPNGFLMSLEMLIQENLEKMQETLGGQMMILTVCGIGCLALLISLPLFGKVLRRFHP